MREERGRPGGRSKGCGTGWARMAKGGKGGGCNIVLLNGWEGGNGGKSGKGGKATIGGCNIV